MVANQNPTKKRIKIKKLKFKKRLNVGFAAKNKHYTNKYYLKDKKLTNPAVTKVINIKKIFIK